MTSCTYVMAVEELGNSEKEVGVWEEGRMRKEVDALVATRHPSFQTNCSMHIDNSSTGAKLCSPSVKPAEVISRYRRLASLQCFLEMSHLERR